jgi:predicted GNAT family acetyltransferase
VIEELGLSLINLNDFPVTHNSAEQRFEMNVRGELAVISYRLSPGLISIDHTGVPVPIEGHGVAAKLTRAALDFARSENLRVVPACSYVAAFVRKHSEYQDLVSVG